MSADDELIGALIPLAEAGIKLVHAGNATAVADLFARAAHLAGDPLTGARAVAVIALGMCSEEHTPAATLGWTRDPARYRQLRANHDALTASLRAGLDDHDRPQGQRGAA